ncbi:MAG TPA: hypothetical protein VHX88_04005 [Solirubrobacteraceae bacterium]|jgi:hypothetical protein|nr:hypothetical protein [Solirubrobacteraceae bacterium]
MTGIRLLAVHGLVVKKAGGATAVADLLGRDEAAVLLALDAAEAEGHVMAGKGTYIATPAGRAWLDAEYPNAFANWRASGEAAAAYEAFEKVNRSLLTVFTDWQMMPVGAGRVANDHSDAEYDNEVIDRFGAQHERAQRPLGMFEQLDGRMGEYTRRLDAAYERVLAGDYQFMSGVGVGSYHTVWFELHEDLLRMLGREREEPS